MRRDQKRRSRNQEPLFAQSQFDDLLKILYPTTAVSPAHHRETLSEAKDNRYLWSPMVLMAFLAKKPWTSADATAFVAAQTKAVDQRRPSWYGAEIMSTLLHVQLVGNETLRLLSVNQQQVLDRFGAQDEVRLLLPPSCP